MKTRKGTIFSTELRSVCPRCGWPTANCHCARKQAGEIPSKISLRMRISKAGRRGKTVTVLEGLPRNSAFLKELARELKKACGAGGCAGEDFVEIQGDRRDQLRELLKARGWIVKG